MKNRTAIILLFLLVLAGCAKKTQPVQFVLPASPTPAGSSTPSNTVTPISTPAVKIKPEISRAPTGLPLEPSPTLTCTNGLAFVADLTVPDGTRIARGVEIDKRWQVKNSGTCNWGEGYSLALIAGPDLGQPQKQALIPARAGAEVMISLLLIAPVIPGTYTSAWQAHSPAGEPFGDVIYLQFLVN